MRSPDGHTLPVRGIERADAVRFQAPPVPRAQLMYWRFVWIPGWCAHAPPGLEQLLELRPQELKQPDGQDPNAGSSLEGPSPTNSASGRGARLNNTRAVGAFFTPGADAASAQDQQVG
jgi:hypothetical protein